MNTQENDFINALAGKIYKRIILMPYEHVFNECKIEEPHPQRLKFDNPAMVWPGIFWFYGTDPDRYTRNELYKFKPITQKCSHYMYFIHHRIITAEWIYNALEQDIHDVNYIKKVDTDLWINYGTLIKKFIYSPLLQQWIKS